MTILDIQACIFPFAFLPLIEKRSSPWPQLPLANLLQQKVVLEDKPLNVVVLPPQSRRHLQCHLEGLEKFEGYVWKKLQHYSLLKLVAMLVQAFSFVLLWCKMHKVPS